MVFFSGARLKRRMLYAERIAVAQKKLKSSDARKT
jgi:hypothetical protein